MDEDRDIHFSDEDEQKLTKNLQGEIIRYCTEVLTSQSVLGCRAGSTQDCVKVLSVYHDIKYTIVQHTSVKS